MSRQMTLRWTLSVVAIALAWFVLGLYRPGSAAPQPAKEPFANSVEQRGEMIEQLKAIVAELKEQNALLKSGKLTVVVSQDKQDKQP